MLEFKTSATFSEMLYNIVLTINDEVQKRVTYRKDLGTNDCDVLLFLRRLSQVNRHYAGMLSNDVGGQVHFKSLEAMLAFQQSPSEMKRNVK